MCWRPQYSVVLAAYVLELCFGLRCARSRPEAACPGSCFAACSPVEPRTSLMQCQFTLFPSDAYTEDACGFRYAPVHSCALAIFSIPGGLFTSLSLTDAPWRALRGSVYRGLLNHAKGLLLPRLMVLHDYRSVRSHSVLARRGGVGYVWRNQDRSHVRLTCRPCLL